VRGRSGSAQIHILGRALGRAFTAARPFSIKPALNCSIRCGHVLLTAEKIRALVDNIRCKKDRDIEGEVVKKDDDDG
jgi:hypothetical protein